MELTNTQQQLSSSSSNNNSHGTKETNLNENIFFFYLFTVFIFHYKCEWMPDHRALADRLRISIHLINANNIDRYSPLLPFVSIYLRCFAFYFVHFFFSFLRYMESYSICPKHLTLPTVHPFRTTRLSQLHIALNKTVHILSLSHPREFAAAAWLSRLLMMRIWQ